MQAPPPFWAAVLFSIRSEKRRDVICPQGAQRHHEHHRRDHVRHGEVLHLGDAAARCDEQKAAAGLEVADHRRHRERIDRLGGEKQRKKHRRLRHRHERCHRAQIAGKDHRREKVQNRLAQNTVAFPVMPASRQP